MVFGSLQSFDFLVALDCLSDILVKLTLQRSHLLTQLRLGLLQSLELLASFCCMRDSLVQLRLKRGSTLFQLCPNANQDINFPGAVTSQLCLLVQIALQAAELILKSSTVSEKLCLLRHFLLTCNPRLVSRSVKLTTF
ncbi:hypothetical protein WT00_16440 [Burkholderia territorii]|nr:hypothetical protein WT00_16440 [Burkholderia territorii]